MEFYASAIRQLQQAKIIWFDRWRQCLAQPRRTSLSRFKIDRFVTVERTRVNGNTLIHVMYWNANDESGLSNFG